MSNSNDSSSKRIKKIPIPFVFTSKCQKIACLRVLKSTGYWYPQILTASFMQWNETVASTYCLDVYSFILRCCSCGIQQNWYDCIQLKQRFANSVPHEWSRTEHTSCTLDADDISIIVSYELWLIYVWIFARAFGHADIRHYIIGMIRNEYRFNFWLTLAISTEIIDSIDWQMIHYSTFNVILNTSNHIHGSCWCWTELLAFQYQTLLENYSPLAFDNCKLIQCPNIPEYLKHKPTLGTSEKSSRWQWNVKIKSIKWRMIGCWLRLVSTEIAIVYLEPSFVMIGPYLEWQYLSFFQNSDKRQNCSIDLPFSVWTHAEMNNLHIQMT